MKALDIAATGMQAMQTQVEVVSQNLSNMSTSGYKRQRPEFQDLIYIHQRRVGANANDTGVLVPAGISLGMGVKTAAVYRVHQQGDLQRTDNALDLAIQGRGFFQVQMANGDTAYTRAGAFQLSADGEIVTQDGLLVLPGITVPIDASDLSVNENGEVLVRQGTQQTITNLGQMQLATFINPTGMEAIGNGLLLETEASGAPTEGVPGQEGYGSILQGFIENSNVDPVAEVTNLILAQRAYEMNSKIITAADEMYQTLNQVS